jgi:hypothetical protein
LFHQRAFKIYKIIDAGNLPDEGFRSCINVERGIIVREMYDVVYDRNSTVPIIVLAASELRKKRGNDYLIFLLHSLFTFISRY